MKKPNNKRRLHWTKERENCKEKNWKMKEKMDYRSCKKRAKIKAKLDYKGKEK